MTTTEVVPYNLNGQRDWVELMGPAAELARQVVDTTFVPKTLRGNGPAIVAAILYGDELGLGPMQSLSKIAVIDGKPTLSAEAQRALILGAGHELWIVEATNTRVTVAGRRHGSERTSEVTWTLDDAKQANLAGRPAYRMYPRQMLTARATAELARVLFADVIGGLAATEELIDADPLELEAPTQPSATRKRRRNKAETSTPVEAPPDDDGDELPLPDLPETETADDQATPIPGLARSVEPDDTIPFGDDSLGAEPATQSGPAMGGEAQPNGSPLVAAESAPEKPLTLNQAKKKMNAIVGQLRETGHITTIQLWDAMARQRHMERDNLILLLEGHDQAGTLHWSPLRDSLTLDEARNLHARLARLFANVEADKALNG